MKLFNPFWHSSALKLLLMMIGTWCFLPSKAYAHTFQTYLPDPAATISPNGTDIALNAAGNPSVCYYETTNDILKYASFDGVNWSAEIADNDGMSGDRVGAHCAILFDDNDNPHIVYFNSTDNDLRHAVKINGGWVIRTIDDNVSLFEFEQESRLSIAKDQNGTIGVAYHERAARNLKYAQFSGGVWSVETVLSDGDVGRYPSLAFDSQNRPAIIFMNYTDNSNAKLQYIIREDQNWGGPEDIDAHNFSGMSSSLKFDADDTPHVTYNKIDGDRLKKLAYTLKTDGGWLEPEIISSASAVGAETGGYAELAIGEEGRAHIFYRNYFRSALFGAVNYLKLYSRYFINAPPENQSMAEDRVTFSAAPVRDYSGLALDSDFHGNLVFSWAEDTGNDYSLHVGILDSWSPSITLLTPNHERNRGKNTFSFSWLDFDPDSNAKIQFRYWNGNEYVDFGDEIDEDAANSAEIDISQIPAGEYFMVAQISDNNFATAVGDAPPVDLIVEDHINDEEQRQAQAADNAPHDNAPRENAPIDNIPRDNVPGDNIPREEGGGEGSGEEDSNHDSPVDYAGEFYDIHMNLKEEPENFNDLIEVMTNEGIIGFNGLFSLPEKDPENPDGIERIDDLAWEHPGFVTPFVRIDCEKSSEFIPSVDRLLEEAGELIQGIGGMDLTISPWTDENIGPADWPLTDLYSILEEEKLWIMIKVKEEQTEALEEALDLYPKIKFIVYGLNRDDLVDELLLKHDNAFFILDALTLLTLEDHGDEYFLMNDEDVNESDNPFKEFKKLFGENRDQLMANAINVWLPLVEKHPHHIFWGSGISRRWQHHPEVYPLLVDFSREWVGSLEESIQEDFAVNNALDFFNPLTLDSEGKTGGSRRGEDETNDQGNSLGSSSGCQLHPNGETDYNILFLLSFIFISPFFMVKKLNGF